MPLKLASDNPTKPLQNIKHIIGVAAGKGGVGKSTVTVYLARALKHQGFKVGLLDADIYGPSLRMMLQEGDLPSAQDNRHFPAKSEEMQVMSMGYFRQEHEASAVRSPVACSILTQFIKDIDWGDLDFLLIDFPPGTGDIQLTLSQQITLAGVIMVTTPQEVAMMDVKKACHLFEQVKVPLLGVIENMSYYEDPNTHEKKFIFGKGGGQKLAQLMHLPLLGEIPLDSELSLSGDHGTSLLDSHPQSQTAQVFTKLAHDLQNLINPKSEKPTVNLSKSQLLISWPDGIVKNISFMDLQKKCSCAGCHNSPKNISHDVEVLSFSDIGRYALRFQFSSGCSKGIYHFDNLREFI